MFNKIDLVDDELVLRRYRRRYPDALFVSARTGAGLPELIERLAEQLESSMEDICLLIPHSRYDLVAQLHRNGAVTREEYLDEGIRVDASVPRELVPAVDDFSVRNDDDGLHAPE